MSNKKNITTRQRGTPSPGSLQQTTRISPRRTSSSTSNTSNNNNNNNNSNNSNSNSNNNLRSTQSNSSITSSTSTLQRRIGSNGNNTSQKNRSVQPTKPPPRDTIVYEDNHDEFLSQSSKYQTDPADQEVMSIYLESLNPRERDSIQNFVNQQKIEAGFNVEPPMTQNTTPKRNSSNYNQIKHTISVGISDIESNISDLSDTPTEVIGYPSNNNNNNNNNNSNSNNNRQSNGKSSSKNNIQNRQSGDNNIIDGALISPRPGAQRAILEIASQMTQEDILEVIELLNKTVKTQPQPNNNNSNGGGYSLHTQNINSTGLNNNNNNNSKNNDNSSSNNNKNSHQSSSHIPSPHTRRGKSGPPILQSSNFTINQDDEEVIQHTKHNETYRLIPPAATLNNNGHGHSSSKYGRSSSAQSNTSGTNSAPNSLSSTPINIYKKSPVPITNPFNPHDICPTVYRESHPNSRSTDVSSSQPFLTKVNIEPPLVLPKTERVESNKISLPSQKNNHSNNHSKNSSHGRDGNIARNILLESLHSPRSAFDDCSLSSSSSNFTSASTKSGRSKGSASITKVPSSNSSATEQISNTRYR